MKRIDPSQKETKELMLKGSQPVVSLFRYPPDEFVGLNPSVRVYISESPDRRPADLLAAARDFQKKLFPDFKVVEDVREIALAGQQAATFAASFTSKYAGGESYPTLSRAWAVKRGTFMYVIGSSGPQDPPAELERDFKMIISSFRFTNASDQPGNRNSASPPPGAKGIAE